MTHSYQRRAPIGYRRARLPNAYGNRSLLAAEHARRREGVEALCRLLPDADLFTLFYDPGTCLGDDSAPPGTDSFLHPVARCVSIAAAADAAGARKLRSAGYDLVISSESGPAKGVMTPSRARHVCYCHTPMRYLWDLYPAYLHEWTARLEARADGAGGELLAACGISRRRARG